MDIDVRMATVRDVELLIKARFDYFEAEKWESTCKQHSVIESNLQRYFTKHLHVDFLPRLLKKIAK